MASRRHPPKIKAVPIRKKPEPEARLADVASRALLITRDAVANVRDLVENATALALMEVKRCEKELDDIEREIDDQVLSAMGRTTKGQARSLLVSLHVISDLERVGDLMLIAAYRFHDFHPRPPAEVRNLLIKVTRSLQVMLENLQRGFKEMDPRYVSGVLRNDRDIDQIQRNLITRLLRSGEEEELANALNLLVIIQVFERAGDHLKNVAEELFFLVEARSLRHLTTREREAELASLG